MAAVKLDRDGDIDIERPSPGGADSQDVLSSHLKYDNGF
jgi:hypothetical protein